MGWVERLKGLDIALLRALQSMKNKALGVLMKIVNHASLGKLWDEKDIISYVWEET